MTRFLSAATISIVSALLVACGAPPATSTQQSPMKVDAGGDGTEVWSRWGGPGGDFQVADGGLVDSWPAEGPPQIWSRALGPGYSGIVTDGGTLYTMYRDGDEDVAIALKASDGETIWERRVEAPTREANQIQFGAGPNATPLVLGDRVITLGYTGNLDCLEKRTGAPVWSHDLIRDFDGEVLSFGYSASPVHHDGRVIVLIGGKSQAVAAFDAGDGSVVWTSAAGSVSYATPIVIDVDGQEQLVYFSADEVIGLDAASGERLWSHPCVNQYNNNATDAIWGDDNLLWVATQLDGGTRVLHLSQSEGATAVEEIWTNNKVKIHFWNALRLGDHVYASIGSQAKFIAAIDINTGEILWRERGFEQINLVQAGDKTLFLDAGGHLALANLSPEGLTVVSQTRIVEDVTWTPPTLVGTTLYVRDKTSIRALDLSG